MQHYQQFLTDYIDAWNEQDVDKMKSFFTEDVVYIDQAVGVNLDMAHVGDFLTAFIGNYTVGFKVTVTHACENPNDETLAYEWDVEGESTTGTKMFIQGISYLEMRGDKIKRNVDYWNRADSPKAQAKNQ